MDEEIAELFLDVGHARASAIAPDDAMVADLAAGFSIERRLVEDDEAGLAGAKTFDLGAVGDDGRGDALRFLGVVPQEFSGAGPLAQGEPDCFRRRVAGAGPSG